MGRPGRSAIGVGVVVLAAGVFALYLASSHGLFVPVLVIGALLVIGVLLAATQDRDSRLGEVGRAMFVSALFAAALGYYDGRAKDRQQQQSLALTISLQRDLRGADLSGQDLSGFLLASKNLAGANLNGAQLNNATLTEANLTGASLDGANLRGADLTGARLDAASLAKADLTGATLTKANLDGATLPRAILTGAILEGTQLPGACLARANLSDAELPGAALWGAQLRGATVSGARFSEDFRPAFLRATTQAGQYLPSAGLSDLIGRATASGLPNGRLSNPAPPASRGRPPATAVMAKVTEVSDGDTVRLGPHPARLLSLNAPPVGARAGRRAKRFLSRLKDQRVKVEDDFETDIFGRRLVFLWHQGTLINQALVARGLAVATINPASNHPYSRRIEKAEEIARDQGRGIWSSGCPSVAP